MVIIKVLQELKDSGSGIEKNKILGSLECALLRDTERAPLHSTQFLEILLNTIPAPVFYKDREGRYLGCNEIFAKEIIGLPKEEVIGKTLSELRPETLPLASESHKPEMQFFLEGENKTYEVKFRCADRKDRNFIVNQNSLKDEKGKNVLLVGVMLDVTERKQAEEALQNNVSFLETLLDNIPNPVFQRDRNGIYISCNEKFASFIVLPKEKIIGKSFLELQDRMNEKIREMYQWDNMQLLQRGGSHNYEVEIQFADSTKKAFLFTKATYNDNAGKVAGIAGVITDISGLKQAEKELKKKTEELSEAKKRLDLALEATKMGTWEWNVSAGNMIWDDNLFRLIGIPRRKFNHPCKDLIELGKKRVHPEDNGLMCKAVRDVLEGKTDIYEIEQRLIQPDRSISYFFVKGRAYRNSKGKLERMIGTAHDITDRKKAEKALQESDERYRIASEQTGHVIYDLDIASGRIDWAGAIEEVMGFSPEEFRAFDVRAWEEHIHPEDQERVTRIIKELQQQGKEKYRNEYRIRRKDGNYCYVEDIGVFLKDENGKAYRLIGVKKDISMRKLVEKKLRESEERHRSFIQNCRGIAYRLDMNHIPIFIGGDIEEITGYRAGDFLSGKIKWKQIVGAEDRAIINEKNEKLSSVPNYKDAWEYQILHRDGNIRWVHEIVHNICDEAGTPTIIQGSIYDITRQKIAEEKLRKNEEIRKKEIHHRIKNNLQVICSLLELQADKFDDKKVQEAFRESQNRIISMTIIHEELYRDRSGNDDGKPETIDFAAYLGKLTDELVHTYAVESEGLDLKLTVDRVFLGIDTAIPLGILINELVSNALKHAFPKGWREKKEIEIKLSKARDGDADYSLVFSDNGTGFPAGIDFRDAESLGLQLVNTLVEQLEGSIELEQAAGTKGTKYRIRFRETK